MSISGDKRFYFIIISIFIGIFLFAKCSFQDRKVDQETVEYSQFAGSAACSQCHKNIFEKHLQTEHFLSSGLPTNNNIKGNFVEGTNDYHFTDMSSVMMERRRDSLFQVEYIMKQEKQKSSIDIVVGSGRKGQSFLSWKNNSLIQLP